MDGDMMDDPGFTGRQCDVSEIADIRQTPIEDILRQHRKRFIISTAKYGDVVMRYLPRSSRIPIDALRYQTYPELYLWEDEFRTLAPLAQLPEADDKLKDDVRSLISKIMPTLNWYALACIEFPMLDSMEDLDTFLDLLTETEQEAIRQMLSVLTAHAGPVDVAYMEIAERFNVQVVDRELLDNMTMQQQEILQGILNAERQKERELYKRMGVKI